jgi:hypothetical protein
MKPEERLQEMSRRLTDQIAAVNELAAVFAQGSRDILRHDQAASLRILKTRIMNQVQNIEQTEADTKVGQIKTSLVNGLQAFVVGSFLSAATGISDQPFKFRLGHALAGFSKVIPYGKVLIAVGKKGVPDDVSIVPVSRLARESKRTEPEAEASLKHDGYLLMAPEKLAQLLDKVERAVLDGSLSLPINVDRLTK